MRIEMAILWHQAELLRSGSYITAMSCGRGAGKTSTLCIKAIHDMLAGKKVLVIEPIFSQFRTVLMPEMESMMSRMGVQAVCNKSHYRWKRGLGEIIGVSAESCERLRGISEVNTLLMDECGSYDEETFTLAIPTMRGLTVLDPRICLFSTATSKNHWFCKKAMDEKTCLVYATSKDNSFNGPHYFKNLTEQYEGLPEDFIQREIYGKFTDYSHNTIFKEIAPCMTPRRGMRVAGVDLALGGDYTAFVMFDGNILSCMEKAKTPTPADAEKFVSKMCLLHKPAIVNYDCTGHGSYAEVGKWACGVQTNPVNFGMAGGRYADMRTKIYFDLFFKMKDFYVAVEPGKYRELAEDLKATNIDENNKARPKLIEKEEIRKLLGRSPDYGDAAALASIPLNEIDFSAMRAAQVRNNPYGSNR